MKCEKCKFKGECQGAEYHSQAEVETCPVFKPKTNKTKNCTEAKGK